ncbi:uncharacterized protein NECHADRAFT_51650, partial [Fusarium vanettenii 77-13-4]
RRPTVGVAVSHVHHPPNIPGQTWLGLTVTTPVNAATPPHTHAGAAVVATVIRGHVLNQMTRSHDSGAKIYGPGESWYEAPGCHHVRSETVGDEECVFIANLIVSTDTFKGLDVKSRAPEDDLAKILRVVIIDKEVEEQQAAAGQQ